MGNFSIENKDRIFFQKFPEKKTRKKYFWAISSNKTRTEICYRQFFERKRGEKLPTINIWGEDEIKIFLLVIFRNKRGKKFFVRYFLKGNAK